MSAELKPCPFCGVHLVMTGEKLRIWKHPMTSLQQARCPGSHASIEEFPDPDPEKVAAWNRRASPASRDDVIEECAVLVDGLANKHGWNYDLPTVGREIAHRIRSLKTEHKEQDNG